jgi:hypothetical protein
MTYGGAHTLPTRLFFGAFWARPRYPVAGACVRFRRNAVLLFPRFGGGRGRCGSSGTRPAAQPFLSYARGN